MLEAREILSPRAGVREQNRRRLIIEVMIKSDRQSRIARRLGMSGASVSGAIQELSSEGIVASGREPANRKGHSSIVRLTPMRGVALGIDLGFRRTAVIGRRVDRPHTEISVRRQDEGAMRGFKQMLTTIEGMIAEVLENIGQNLADVVSVGIAVPRMINPRTGRFTTPVLPPWDHADEPAEALEQLLKVRVAIDNDANLGAMAEQIYGLDEPIETVVYVKASTGVGAGIMYGDKLLRGDRGMAGEIGHLTVDRDGDICLCGGRGCLDTVIGAETLLSQLNQARRRATLGLTSLTALIDSANSGDAACRRILSDAGRNLGFALAQLCNIVNPRLVVVGGELATAKELVLEPCAQEMRRYALSGAVNSGDGFDLRASALDGLAEAQGALILGLRSRQVESTG